MASEGVHRVYGQKRSPYLNGGVTAQQVLQVVTEYTGKQIEFVKTAIVHPPEHNDSIPLKRVRTFPAYPFCLAVRGWVDVAIPAQRPVLASHHFIILKPAAAYLSIANVGVVHLAVSVRGHQRKCGHGRQHKRFLVPPFHGRTRGYIVALTWSYCSQYSSAFLSQQ